MVTEILECEDDSAGAPGYDAGFDIVFSLVTNHHECL